MKKKNLLMTAIAIFGLATITMAQVPSYVPTNGLVGWWPFNGNANDESGNGNNGTVNGATLTTDRNGVGNKAYSFDGVSNNIVVTNSNNMNVTELSVVVWYLANGEEMTVINKNDPTSCSQYSFGIHHQYTWQSSGPGLYTSTGNGNCNSTNRDEHWGPYNSVPSNQWVFIVYTINNIGISKTYLNGILLESYTGQNIISCNSVSSTLRFGGPHWNTYNMFVGKIDDIGIWNRALTECEIQDLYSSQLNSTFVNAGVDQTICIGEPVTLSAINSLNYSWDNGVTDGVAFNPTATQDYTVSADSAGCLSTDVVTVTVNEHTTATQTETALDTYTWPINSQTYTQSGTYTAVIPNAAGCDSTITLDLSLDFTGLEENSEGALFYVFPNPAQSIIIVKADDKLIGDVYTIYENTGRVVLTGKLNSQNTTIELGNLSGGIYMFSVEKNMKQTFKVIKE